MKKLFLILIMLIGMINAKAQEVQIDHGNHPDFQTEITRIIGNIDISPVTSNLLLDKGFPFVELSDYKGTNTLADSNLLDINDFGSIYATVYGASLDPAQPSLPNPDNAYMGALQSYTPNAPIPLTLLLYRYEQFKPTAITDNLLAWQNDVLYDVPNRPTHPFQSQNVFAASPIRNFSDKRDVVFSVPTTLFHYNLGQQYVLEIDFDDNQGFRAVNMGQANIAINYPNEGLKKIKFRIRLPNALLTCHALFEIVLPDPSRSFQGTPAITLADITLSSSANGATIKGFSNCGDGKIRKPLIWVEGFNPTTTIPGFDLDFNWMRGKYERSEFVGTKRLWKHLEDEGYDLIYVDFKDGAGDLRENSKVV